MLEIWAMCVLITILGAAIFILFILVMIGKK